MNLKLLKIFLLSFILLCSCDSSAKEEQHIHEVIKKFNVALKDNDGELAYSLIDFNTKNYYDHILNMAKYLPKEDVYNLSNIDKIEILKARQVVNKDILSKMSSKDYFIYCFNKRYISFPLGLIEKGKIKVVATDFALLLTENEKEGMFVIATIRKEKKSWKIDLLTYYETRDKLISIGSQLKKVPEDKYIEISINELFPKENINDIWEPIKGNL